MSRADSQIIIVGAGLAGLCAAKRLRRDYRILEQRQVAGGLADTVVDHGFRFDRTGHLLHLSDRRAKRLVFELVGDRLIEIQRRARIFSHGVFTHYPFQANTFGLPREVAAECVTGFVEAYVQRAGRRARARTFAEFIQANFGSGIARHFMIPYNKKLWGVHPRQITDEWCERFVPTPQLSEVVTGALGLPRQELGYNAEFYYPRHGIGELAQALTSRVGHIEYGARPTAIDFRSKRLRLQGSWVPFRALISTVPLDRLVTLLVQPPRRIANAAAKLGCAQLRYLDVALTRKPGNDYHWTYVPERKYPFYRVGSYSNFSEEVVPRGKGSLYVELASRRPINLDRLMPRVTAGLTEMGVIGQASDIAFVRPRLIRQAYVLYDADWSRSRSALLGWLERQQIFCAGRYGRWEYASMENAILQGLDAADRARGL